MNIQRFHALTAREALAKARMAFGDNTLILSNRTTDTGVEVLATTDEALSELDHGAAPLPIQRATPKTPVSAAPSSSQAQVEADVAQLSMSTLSFQDYVRERMLQRRHESKTERAMGGASTAFAPTTAANTAPDTSNNIKKFPTRATTGMSASTKAAATALSPALADELHAMKALIEERFDTLTWLGQAKQDPIHASLLLKLIRAGFSPDLSRALLEKMPTDVAAAEAVQWVMEVLARNLKTEAPGSALEDMGGIYALVGATGVGKTTTTAKLAGLCARAHGPASVGLITLDTYRVGAHEQLRTYGRTLGVVAHLAHDQATLQDMIGLLSNKKMILIDTIGMSPRDVRKREVMDMLTLPQVNRLLVLNAVSHGDAMDEVISSFRGPGVQQAVLSKIDEAVKLGPVLDAAVRHQLVLRGVTSGQKIPDGWEVPDAQRLIRLAMRSPGKSAFDPQVADLDFIFSQTSGHANGRLHA